MEPFDRLLDAVADKLPALVDYLEVARADVLAFAGFRKEVRRQIWSNAPQRRGPPAHRRRGVFPGRTSIIRLVGAVLAEQHDERAEGRGHPALDVRGRSRLTAYPDTQEVNPPSPGARRLTIDDHAEAVTHHTPGLDRRADR